MAKTELQPVTFVHPVEQCEQLSFDLPRDLHETPYSPVKSRILSICAEELLKMYCGEDLNFDERRELNQEHGYKKAMIHNKLYSHELQPASIRLISRSELHYLESFDEPEECTREVLVSLVPRITVPSNGISTPQLPFANFMHRETRARVD